MFVVNFRNFRLFLSKIRLRSVLALFNSIILFTRTYLYVTRGVRSVDESNVGGRVLLLIHFGLGDFFNMLPAIRYFASRNEEVHVFVSRRNLAELERFLLGINVYLRAIEDEVGDVDCYLANVSCIQKKYPHYKLLTCGRFSGKFAFYYPASFYIELGVDPDIAFSDRLDLDESILREPVLKFFRTIEGPYIFTHLTASDDVAAWDEDVDCNTLILDPFINRNLYPSKNFDVAQAYLEMRLHLIEHLFFLTRSSQCFLIDSSFFNFLAHTSYEGTAKAYMRGQYFHKLDERLLKKFDSIKML
jgi:hypothetical protein